MRTSILSALLAIGLGAASVQASPISAINNAVSGQGAIELAQFGPPPPPPGYGPPPPPPGYRPPPPHFRPPPPVRCRNIRICDMTPFGRRCHYERVCRRVW